MGKGSNVKFFKFLLAVLCIAILVLGTLLAYNLHILPEMSRCVDETAAKLTDTAADIPPISGEAATTATTETSAVTEQTTATEPRVLTEQECKEQTLDAVSALSVWAGDEEVLQNARVLLATLENNGVQEYYELLSAILAYADGKGDPTVLSSATATADQKIVRQAAVSCWAQSQKKDNTVVLSFAGDCTFGYFNERDRLTGFPAVYKKSGSVTYPFDNVRGVFSADDITAVNFEGTLTDSKKYADKQFYFRGKAEYAKILSGSSVESANLANNHTLDYYEKGFEDTVKALESEKIGVFWASEPCVRSIRTDGGTVSVVMLSTSSIDVKNQSKFAELKMQIERYESPNTIVVVNLHWGTELAVKPSEWQVKTARELVDAGADLIIGHHPHVLQGIEKYNGVYIAYSIGNFAFGGNSKANYPETVILRAVFDVDAGEVGECSISAVPCYTTSSGGNVNDYKPSLQYGKKGQAVIDLVLERSAMLEDGITELLWHGI